jgi:ubiquinone/menaquinone biosynthesis C-methylase UbiE
MSFKKRSREPELMDSGGEEEEVRSALSELNKINRFLGGNAVTAAGIMKIRKKFNLSEIKILDAGSGNSDILFQKKIKATLEITSLDKNLFICRLIQEKGRKHNIICGDVLHLPFRSNSFDLVHASLFMHHFDEEEIIILLTKFLSVSKYGILVNDLHRSFIAYYGFKILSGLFSRNRLVKHDGLVSVKRGFRIKELKKMLNRTGFKYHLQWRWAFRWLLVIYSNERI